MALCHLQLKPQLKIVAVIFLLCKDIRMGKYEKLLDRLRSRPVDFTFDEMETVLTGFGYRRTDGGKTTGSAVRFIHSQYQVIRLHKPHPGNELKRYAISDVLEKLESEGLI
ncbi:MAG: type II toxin-antitoxin system HicA family toxin [Sulfuricellaceae bacterium]